jgi:hypothetical protein
VSAHAQDRLDRGAHAEDPLLWSNAVVSHNLETVKRLVASGSAVDHLHCGSETALIAASREGQNQNPERHASPLR